MNPVTREEYEALNAKLDIYIRTQNALEKDFRETERKVYRLEQVDLSPQMPRRYLDGETQGIAWLR